jgi:hypothetical protein
VTTTEIVPTDQYAFGSRDGGPKFKVLAKGMIGPESLPLPDGGSVFADPLLSGLKGPYHVLARGTLLPEELGIAADGKDVIVHSPHPPTHHTIYPKARIAVEQLLALLKSLPWKYAGRIR